jgi:hypothetical protein
MVFWCEKEPLLHEIFGFHHLAACVNQTDSTFDDFLNVLIKFSTHSKDFIDLHGACEFLRKDCHKIIFGQYGCAMVGFCTCEQMIQLYLVCLDDWKFTIKSNIIERQHIATPNKCKFMFITEFPVDAYESFVSSFHSNLYNAKNIKGREMYAVQYETTHQKTPSFIFSVFQTTVERYFF